MSKTLPTEFPQTRRTSGFPLYLANCIPVVLRDTLITLTKPFFLNIQRFLQFSLREIVVNLDGFSVTLRVTTSLSPSVKRNMSSISILDIFTCIINNEIQHLQCVVCTEVLVQESLQSAKMLRHLKTKHPSLAPKPTDFFLPKRESSQKALYKGAYLITQGKKPCTIGETLIKPVVIAMCWTMHGDKQVQEMEAMLLSDGTMSRQITDITHDIKCQLIDRVKKGMYTLQLEESLDVSNSINLLVFVRYNFDGKFNEDMLLCTPLECIGVCTDSAAALLWKKNELKGTVLKVVQHVNFIHCIIHRGALAKSVFEVKMVNFVKSRPLNTRLLTTFCSELGSEHQVLNRLIMSLNDKIRCFNRKWIVGLQKLK
uniref:BED-type domain-containing protein n=1 Tax=Acanthochromis polyacanthus TaxID=80966 RepID=A0A3Q1FAP6_9TELE